VSNNAGFFDRRQAAAVLKHGILKRYPVVFASKTGRWQDRGRTAIIDAYAGPGQYDDGADGSPLLLTDVALFAEQLGRQVTLVFAESNEEFATNLKVALHERGAADAPVLVGDFESRMHDALSICRGMPLLTFLDPFGTSISYDSLTTKLMGRARTKSEVLLHFSLSSVARKGAIARTPETVSADAFTRQLDTFLGGTWWHEMMPSSDERFDGDATRAAIAISDEYARRVCARCACRSIAVDVYASTDPCVLPKYRLMLFTRSDHGLWAFADAAGRAHLEWLQFCEDREVDRLVEADRRKYQSDGLFPRDRPDPKELQRLLDKQVGPVLDQQLSDLLERGPVQFGRDTIQVYGRALGHANERHVGHSARRLVEAGVAKKPDRYSNLVGVTLEPAD